MPPKKIIYSDIINHEKNLFSPSLIISGNLYIIRTKDKTLFPVEGKTGDHTQPKPWHIMQIISYLHLVSESFQKIVPFGILLYPDTKNQFQIPYNKKYHSLLLSTINQMHKHLRTNEIMRFHSDISKCDLCYNTNIAKTCRSIHLYDSLKENSLL